VPGLAGYLTMSLAGFGLSRSQHVIYLKQRRFYYGFSMPFIFGNQISDIETQSQQYIKEARTFKVTFRYFACREAKVC
jgi:hypothetical protein